MNLEESGWTKKLKFILFQFFPHGDPSKFASLVFRVFDENNVGKLFLRPLDIIILHPRFSLFAFLGKKVYFFPWKIWIYLADNIYFVRVWGGRVNPCSGGRTIKTSFAAAATATNLLLSLIDTFSTTSLIKYFSQLSD